MSTIHVHKEKDHVYNSMDLLQEEANLWESFALIFFG